MDKRFNINRKNQTPDRIRRRFITRLILASAALSFPWQRALAQAAISKDNRTMNQPKRIFITGSSGGLGQMAARLLVEQGHSVVVHGRSPARAAEALKEVPGAEAALYGDFTSLEQIRSLAEQANASGRFDAVIHNAAVGDKEATKVLTKDGLPRLFSVNVMAPYMLTALMERPQRLIYISSSMQFGASGKACLDDLLWEKRVWRGSSAYSESKLLISMLAFAAGRHWPQTFCNTVDPGWVPTRMGGRGAPDDLNQGHLTQAWLAASDDPAALASGRHFYHMATRNPNPDALNPAYQDRLIAECARLSGVTLF